MVLDHRNIFKSANDINTNRNAHIYIRIMPGNIPGSINEIKKAWEKVIPQAEFQSTFLDEDINSKYSSEERLLSIVNTSSLLAIIITCLGLIGLTILITIRKSKEIGIRKVLGASVSSLIGLLSKEFVLLILIANFIAWPVSYFLMNNWLQDFAFKTEIDFLSFLLSGVCLVLIAMFSIISLVYRAANANPVHAIKYE